jgi:hypothetical protein
MSKFIALPFTKLWNLPPKPSQTQLRLLSELIRLSRDEYGIRIGPCSEVRDGCYWIDIAFFIDGFKIAVEVEGPMSSAKKQKRISYLRNHGWKIILVPVRYIDKDVTGTARRILDYIAKITEHHVSCILN